MTDWRRHIPNALTLARFPLAFLAASGWARAHHLASSEIDAAWTWLALGGLAFLAAALSDFFDGRLARAWSVESALGAKLDPLADKVLIAAMLAALALGLSDGGLVAGSMLLPALVIVGRDLGVTLLRARVGFGGALKVSRLAKWKTGVEMTAVAIPFGLSALALTQGSALGLERPAPLGGAALTWAVAGWLGCLWCAAALSAWTGAGYVRAALKTRRAASE